MAGLVLNNGDSLSISGKKFTCAGKGPGGRYQLVPHKGRSNRYLAAEELFDLCQQGKIQLHDDSDYYHELPTNLFNLSSISKAQREQVIMRAYYMKEMDIYRDNGGKLSEKPVTKLAIEIHKKYTKECISKNENVPIKPMSESSLRRWYRKWRNSGGNIMSLVHTPSGNRHSKLNYEQSEWLDVMIKDVYLTPKRRSAKAVHELLNVKINLENRKRARDKLAPIKTPSYNTLCRHIRNLDIYEVLKSRFNHEYAYKMTRHQRSSPDVFKHLEQVQADHTQADIYVDMGIGVLVRPWITLLIDRFSKAIIGYWISSDSPSAQTVMDALRLAILPKNIVELGGNSKWQ
jgi:putative transposase